MQINYRIANDDDLNEIFRMVKLAIETMRKQNIFQWDDLYPQQGDLKEDIIKKQLYVGTIDNQIAAMYVLNQEYDDEYKNANWKHPEKSFYIIHRLCVNPEFQNKGIAKATIQHIEEYLNSIDIEAIRLDVFSENPYALKLYEKKGFTKVGHADWRKGRFYLMEKYL